ncbi:unnamed protein product [Urochloa humidicola]
MAPHLHLLLLPPAALAIAAPGRRRVSFESAGPRAPPRARAASFSCAPGRVQGRLSVAAAAEDGAEPGAGEPAGAMRLNEYMVSVDRPLGVRFALGVDGRVFVHSLRKGGNAEKSRIIMVGDTLKKAGGGEQGLVTIKDLGDTEIALRDKSGPCSLVLERPFAPFPIHQLHQNEDYHLLFNRGRVAVASWNSALLSTELNESSTGDGKSGFAIFSPRLLSSQGWSFPRFDSLRIIVNRV